MAHLQQGPGPAPACGGSRPAPPRPLPSWPPLPPRPSAAPCGARSPSCAPRARGSRPGRSSGSGCSSTGLCSRTAGPRWARPLRGGAVVMKSGPPSRPWPLTHMHAHGPVSQLCPRNTGARASGRVAPRRPASASSQPGPMAQAGQGASLPRFPSVRRDNNKPAFPRLLGGPRELTPVNKKACHVAHV